MASSKRRWAAPAAAAVVASVAALALAMQIGLFHRFDVDGVKINPRAAIRSDANYTLVVWEEAIAAPWAQTTQAQLLEETLREFASLHPNVRVTYELLEPAAAADRLADAVAAGSPPDVYGAARVEWGAYPLPYQVPATPYLIRSHDRGGLPYSDAAVTGLTFEGSLWAWPRGLWWEGWAARRDALLRAGLLRPSDNAPDPDGSWSLRGWHYDALVSAVSSSGAPLTVALDVTSLDLLLQLLPGTGNAPNDAAGAVPWSDAQIAQATDFVRRLLRSGARGRDLDTMSRIRFSELAEGDVHVVGPVNVYSAQAALRRLPDELTVVPPPSPAPEPPALPVVPSAYFVFRQADYKGDDHTRAAAELAALLAAKTEQWLIETVGLLPVTADGWSAWRQNSPWNDSTRGLLAAAADSAAVVRWPPGAAAHWQTTLLPSWRSFLNGEYTPEQMAAAVRRAAERLPRTPP